VAGYILAEGGASKRLVRLARAWIGWMPGGMALMVIFVLAAFTTFTGGSGVTILALGGLVLPMLLSEKYPEGFSLGVVTSSGSLGLLFPPSLPVILYAVVAGASVEDLFIAGFVPCLLLIVLVAVYGIVTGIRHKAPRTPFDVKEAFASLWEAKWEMAIPAVVVLAIFTGFATIVESAAIAVLAAVVSQSFIFRELHPVKQLPGVVVHAATLVGAVLILLGVAMGLTSYLVDAEIPEALLEWTKVHIESKYVFLLALNAVLLVLGSVLEIYAAIVVLAPLLTPMAAAYGIDPLHLGVVFLANLELGFLFPPMGLNLILSSTRFNQPLTRLYKVAFPFLLIMTVGVL
ncbi:MAG: TRAP transporter large permease, partial [Myxococcales bacterium]